MENSVKILKKETFFNENGKEFEKITKEISTPRKTYLKGVISGKYRGNKFADISDESKLLFDFEIYEAEVICKSKEDFKENEAFFIGGNLFPKEKLLDNLNVNLKIENSSFGINIKDPKLYDFKPVRRLHQTEGEEVFGTFNAIITGYILDYKKEIIEEIIEVEVIVLPSNDCKCESNDIKTGNSRISGNSNQTEYHCKHHNDTVWLNDKRIGNKTPPIPPEGCLSEIFGLIGIVLSIIFMLIMLVQIFYFLPFILIFFLIHFLGNYFERFFKIVGLLLLIGFILSLINLFSNNNHYNPKPVVVENQREKVNNEPIKDTLVKNVKDSIITRYRIWKDYDGNQYEGKYQLSLNAFKDSKSFKNNLSVSESSINSYDEIIWKLKERDASKLNGLYKLFDSINTANKLSKIKFAEMIVSFVQDIPYAIILENDCDARLYNDPFTKRYLLKSDALCDPFERFGINTPIEFLMNLKGDCDTRTLFLYTIFVHYKYDVALLSSEFYGHSILGINLPINGLAYNYNNNKYILWETTAPNCKPGIIPNEISNLNNWRISLKSK